MEKPRKDAEMQMWLWGFYIQKVFVSQLWQNHLVILKVTYSQSTKYSHPY